jgi:activator of HSP90 ATPase
MPEKSFAERWVEGLMRKHRRRTHGKDWDTLTDKLNGNFASKNSKAGEMFARKINASSKRPKDGTTAKSHAISSRTRHVVWTHVKKWDPLNG